MSDTADDATPDIATLLDKAKIHSLREQMQAFVDEYDGEEFKAVRASAAEGKPLSETVIEDRDERI
jgi:K+/H+ antiporter YhaU regulatory subunit KhtT